MKYRPVKRFRSISEDICVQQRGCTRAQPLSCLLVLKRVGEQKKVLEGRKGKRSPKGTAMEQFKLLLKQNKVAEIVTQVQSIALLG